MLRALVLVAVMRAVASADWGEQIEGELVLNARDVAFRMGPPAELARPPSRADVEARSTRFADALARTPQPFAKAQLYLARAELWAAYALAEQRAALETSESVHEGAFADALARAIGDYRELYKLKLHGWRPLARALTSFAYVVAHELPHEAAYLYKRVLDEFPASPHAMRARVVHADAALADHRPGDALPHYDAVASSRHAGPQLRVYALYKAATFVLAEREDAERAHAMFVEALRIDRDGPLGWELRNGLTTSFAVFGKPADAHALFARLAPDHALEMLSDLAGHWQTDARHAYALAAYSELVRRDPRHALACHRQGAAVKAASQLGDDTLLFTHVERLVQIFVRARPAGEDPLCAQVVVEYTRDAAGVTESPALARALDDLFRRAFPDGARHVR